MLYNERFSVLRPLEKWSVDDENDTNVESAGEAQCCLLAGNLYNVDALFELLRQPQLISQEELSDPVRG
jgi:hypothetical protein